MASGVQITGLIKPLNAGSFPVFEDTDGLGGWRGVANVTARDAIPANYRKIGMVVVDQSQDPAVAYQLVGGIANSNWQVLPGAFYQFWQNSDGDVPQRRAVKPSSTDFVLTDDAGGNATRFALKPQPAAVTASLATLALLSGYPDGANVFVLDQNEPYRLQATNAFHTFSPLIIAATGGGNWFRRSLAYVVGNFTLWAAPFGGPGGTGDSKFAGFTPGQLIASNAQAPDIILNLAGSINPATENAFGLLVDNLGDLWINSNIGLASGALYKFNLKDCLASGSPTAAVRIPITFPGTSECAYSCFDRQGNLWTLVGTHGTFGVCTIQKFSQHAYTISGSPTPDLTITLFSPGAVAPSTSNVQNLIFDAQGNMWITLGFTGVTTGGGAGNGGIIMLAASQLTATATVVPAVFWAGSNFTGAGIISTSGMCFGPTGLLWVADASGGNRIRAWDIRNPVSGNPAPAIILTSTTFNIPSALTFDTAGNLWACNDGDSLVYRIPKASLGVSGAVVPDVILSQTTVLTFASYISFPSNIDRSGALPSGIPVNQ